MMVNIRRAGGFAGVDEELASVDSSTLSSAKADELRELVTRLSALRAQRPESVGADRFRYEIRVVEPGAEPRTLTVVDEGDPDDAAMKLVHAILELAAARP